MNLHMSVEEIFQRITMMTEIVRMKNFKIPENARLKIAEELIKLGYELAEAQD